MLSHREHQLVGERHPPDRELVRQLLLLGRMDAVPELHRDRHRQLS
jgi:hypothetical protein